MREKGYDFSGRRRRFWGRRGMIFGKGEGEDFEGAGGRFREGREGFDGV